MKSAEESREDVDVADDGPKLEERYEVVLASLGAE